jgi:hypothetical protein
MRKKSGEYVGDTDIRMAAKYDVRVPARIAKVASVLDSADSETWTDADQLDWLLARFAARTPPGVDVDVGGATIRVSTRDSLASAMRAAHGGATVPIETVVESSDVYTQDPPSPGGCDAPSPMQSVSESVRKVSAAPEKRRTGPTLRSWPRRFKAAAIAGAGFEPATFGL